MRVHSNDYKENIKSFGRELDSRVTYIENDIEKELGTEDLNSVSLRFQGNILKSVMRQIDIDSNVYIPKDTILNYQFGVKVREATENDNGYEYISFNNYIVATEPEIQEDTKSYKITCYDKMLLSMKDYTSLGITYPCTIREYISTLCSVLNIQFKNGKDEFVNYDKMIDHELFMDNEGKSLGYTFRDVLDQLAEVTASTICIDEDTGELEIRYITDTKDVINEEYFKNINVTFGEKYGPINSIVLTRSAESDTIYLRDEESVEANGLCEIKISENQFMNFNDRDIYLPEILEKLNGLEYFLNDFSSTGITYFDVCDKYEAEIDGFRYPCILFNDEINITQGLEEVIFTDLSETSETDYSKADKTDRLLSNATLLVNKHEKNIQGLVVDMYEDDGIVHENFTRIYQDINNIITSVQNTGGGNLLLNSVMYSRDENGKPTNWELEGTGSIDIQTSAEAMNMGSASAQIFTLDNLIARQRVAVKVDNDNIPENEKTYYTFSTKIKKNVTGTCYVKIYNTNENYTIQLNEGEDAFYGDYEIKGLLPKVNYYDVEFYGSTGSGATFTDNMFALGQYKSQWQQANGEIMNTQVTVDLNGMRVQSSVYEGNETVITPLEFAGYAIVNGVRTKVFTLNNDTTEVEKLKVRNEMNMPPLKIVPMTSGDMQGWAIVKSGGEL